MQPFPAVWVIGLGGPVHLVIDLGTHERQLGRGVVGVSPQRQSSYHTGLSGQRMVIYATGE